MKYITLVTSATTAMLGLMTLIAANMWTTMSNSKTNPPIRLGTKTIRIPQTDLDGSKKSFRPAFDILVIYKSPVQNSMQDLAKR